MPWTFCQCADRNGIARNLALWQANSTKIFLLCPGKGREICLNPDPVVIIALAFPRPIGTILVSRSTWLRHATRSLSKPIADAGPICRPAGISPMSSTSLPTLMNPSSSRAARERHQAEVKAWKKIVAPFEKPSARRGGWQVASTLAAYAATWAAMLLLQPISWWYALPFVPLAGMLLTRIFVLFHDCCHGSLLPSDRANRILGYFLGVLVFTPYRHWRWEHSIHHASAGDLDRRGVGDVWTMTIAEYQAASWFTRLRYRMVRNPVLLFFVFPVLLFVIRERFASRGASMAARKSLWLTNTGIALMFGLGAWCFGWVVFPVLLVASMGVAGTYGVWLFYVQHQYEGVYWERHHHWEYTAAALQGSSFYKLPRVLQWFSGNIGYHHVHHLSSKIPNYNLERCHHAHELFSKSKVLTLTSSLECAKFRLWDESSRQLVGYARAREIAASGLAKA